MKKEYVKPAMEIMEADMQSTLLAGSSDNPYWQPPEEKEGCETPWWCP